MISINKFFNPDLNPIKMASEIGVRLKNEQSIPMADLIADFLGRYNNGGAYMLADAISILYVVGKIEYNKRTDCLEYKA